MKRALVLAIFSIALALPLFAQEMSSQQKEVWQMEETYWRDVKGFDEAHYMTLWHKGFLGWPQDQKMPIGKVALGEAVHRKFQRKGTLDYEFLSKSVAVTGSVGITQYAVKSSFTGTDGHKASFSSRITHTWLKTDEGWKIVGGMSGPFEPDGHTW
jgi:ketosteroid isomerase-like protein